MSAVIRGGFTVVPWAQGLCDKIAFEGWANSFGTYAGHEPDPEHATDIFVQIGDPVGHTIANFIHDNIDKYGVDYVIYDQHIYNPEISDSWRLMEDRGSPTANHKDHVHVSYVYDFDWKGEDDLANSDEILGILKHQQGQLDNIYAYLFNDRKGEDRSGRGLDFTDQQTNTAVDQIQKDVAKLVADYEGGRSQGVNQDKLVNDLTIKLMKGLRGV